MFHLYEEFRKLFDSDLLKTTNNLLMNSFKKFSFNWNAKESNSNQFKSISQIITMDKFEDFGKEYLVLCSDYKLLIILKNDLKQIFNNFNDLQKITFFSLSENINETFISNILSDEHESRKKEDFDFVNFDENFREEIVNFLEKFHLYFQNRQIIPFWNIIKRSISGYLIKKSYFNSNFDRFIQIDTIKKIEEDQYIYLRNIGPGSSSVVHLVYYIEKEQLFALKKLLNVPENFKLFEREKSNYLKFHHAFLPRYISSKSNELHLYLFIEYINGYSLRDIKKMKLNLHEKLKIIFEIMIVMEYLHLNNYIYRDLKPNNIIINKETAILIDFDRLIENNKNFTNGNATQILSENFSAPEICLGKSFSFEADIYSIGLIIYYIFFEKMPPQKYINDIFQYDFNNFTNEYSKLKEICEQCSQIDPSKRPKISYLINTFYINFFSKINPQIQETKTIQITPNIHSKDFIYYWIYIAEINNPKCLYELGLMYENGILFQRDIEKAIKYFTISANQNFKEAQLKLGSLYLKGEYIAKDINKAIYFYTHAAAQNVVKAQFNLGLIYLNENIDTEKGIYYLKLASDQDVYEAKHLLAGFYLDGKYVKQDIDIGMRYYMYLADKNFPAAYYSLGLIYIDGSVVNKDVNKGLNYLLKSANLNVCEAQYLLGDLYYEGKMVQRDIHKAIKFYSLAAENNHEYSQILLGDIFFGNEIKNIKEGIYYYSLAAKQNNNLNAQLMLGDTFFNGKIIPRDINQAIYYYSLAAKQNNDSYAQLMLGDTFFNGKIIPRDINQAIYYYSLAAKQNNDVKAQNILGLIYANGKYITTDIEKSIYFLKLAANNNDPTSQYNLGVYYNTGFYVKKDIDQAFKYFTAASLKGHSDAQFNLGLIYYYYKHDIEKAIHYLTLSAEQNNCYAQIDLGFLYYIKKDKDKSIYYFELAAKKHNNPMAQCIFALVYYEGILVARDIDKSIHYLTLASQQNFYDAYYLLGAIYFRGEFVIQDINKSISYFKIASNHNHKEAQFYLGFIYYDKEYNRQNIEKAIHYFNISSKNGCLFAHNMLGIIFSDGKYVKKDINKSIYYFTLCANKQFPKAQFNLGLTYYFMQSKQYIKKAIELFALASENDEMTDAFFCLGMIYFEGKYIQRNIEKAIHYYKKLSSYNNQYAKNNLGIIYYHGIDIQKNKYYAVIYLKEAVDQKKDPVSMYNLANIFLNDNEFKKDADESISLLIRSSLKKFYPAKILLCLLIVKKFKVIDLNKIKKELDYYGISKKEFANNLYDTIKANLLEDFNNFELKFSFYNNNYYVYDFDLDYILLSNYLYKEDKTMKIPAIDKNFYLGFNDEI